MIDFLRLIRYKNLLIIAATQYLMRWCIIYPIITINGFELQFSELNFLFLVLSTISLTAAGYIINDYFDRKTDVVNRPDTVVVGTKIHRRLAMIFHVLFNVAGIGLGFYISYIIGLWELGFIFFLITGILWYYSTTYKRQFLIGNIVVSLLTAMVPFMVALFEVPLLNRVYREELIAYSIDFNNVLGWVGGFAFFAFLATLIREILKDIEDYEGDQAYGRNTMPIIIGILSTKIVVISLIIITIACLLCAHIIYVNDIITLIYFIVALILPFFFLAYRIIKAGNKKDYSFTSNLSKIIMLAGLCYAVVAYYNITAFFSE